MPTVGRIASVTVAVQAVQGAANRGGAAEGRWRRKGRCRPADDFSIWVRHGARRYDLFIQRRSREFGPRRLFAAGFARGAASVRERSAFPDARARVLLRIRRRNRLLERPVRTG